MKIVNILFILVIGAIIFVIFSDTNKPVISKPISPIIIPSPTPLIFSEEKLWSLVNEWKINQGSNPYIKDQRLCNLANVRLEEIRLKNNHDGFWNHTNDFPHKELAENLSSDYIFEDKALIGWLNSPPHRKTLEHDYKYSCLKCLGDRCVQLFANF